MRRAAFLRSQESKVVVTQPLFMSNLLMSNVGMSSLGRTESTMKARLALSKGAAGWLLAAVLALGAVAAAQGTSEFTLQPSALSPSAVAPGGVSSTNIQVAPVNGYTGTVALSCTITLTIATTDPPVCTLSPTALAPPGSATATITTKPTTTNTLYSITITGTGTTTTYSAPALDFTVLAVVPQFTITIQSSVSPSSVPAGSGAEGVVSVNPSNGYVTPATCAAGTGSKCGITLACGSITPLVAIAPVCSFTYPGSSSTLTFTGGNTALATLTINTYGPVVTGSRTRERIFYGLWLPIPLLGLVGVGAATGGKRARKAFGLLAVFVLSASFLLMPACGNTTNLISTPNGITPANSYSFTIVGVDSNGVVSSNVSATNTGPTVSLAVTAPPKQ